MNTGLVRWLFALLLTGSLLVGSWSLIGAGSAGPNQSVANGPVGGDYQAANGNATAPTVVTFDRRLSGDRVGQHKAPPNAYIVTELAVSVEAGLAGVTLADYFPLSWRVIYTGDGVVSVVDEERGKIEWALGHAPTAMTFTRDYILLSPERTLPPTKYEFVSELSHSKGSVASDPWEVVVADPPPDSPSNTYSKGITSTSIAVAWVPSGESDVDGYRVYRSGNGTGYSVVATLAGGQLVSSYVDAGLPASTLYYYKIAAWRGTEESSQTQASTARTTAPDPPRGLRAAGGNSTFVSLTWNANTESNLIGYNVYRATSSNGTFIKLNPSLVAATAYADPAPVRSVSYYYRVAAFDSTAAEGRVSAEVRARLYYDPIVGSPHAPYTDAPDTCASCHRSHSGQSPGLLPTTERDLCFTCHDGTGSQYFVAQDFESPSSEHPVMGGTLTCSSCHDPHLIWQDYPRLLNVDGAYSGNAVCYGCHGQNDLNPPDTDYETPFEAGYHKPHVPISSTGTQIQCSSCHKPHASISRGLQAQQDENGCLSCHDGSTVGGDVFTGFAASSDARAHHDVSDADQGVRGTRIECANCHNAHTIASVSKVVNPENPAPASTSLWTGTISDFCVVCHDGTLPTAAQTEPFAPAPQNPTMLPISGGAHVDRYTCETCHDAHGTTNPFHLRSELYSEEQSAFREGLLVIAMADGEYDFRYFCNSCHDYGQHGNSMSLPTNCAASGCHVHGAQY